MPSKEIGAFLPAGYEPPKSNSAYMKFEEGENEFRIMSSPVIGWEYWNKTGGESKPVRLTYTEENAKIAALEASKNPDPKDQKMKHFWAMVVWDYKDSRVKILEITQKGIQDVIRALVSNKKWGSPVDKYDITVTKEGKGQDTTYAVTPSPHTETSEETEIAFNSTFIDVNALFYGKDPFDKNWKDQIDDDTFGTEE